MALWSAVVLLAACEQAAPSSRASEAGDGGGADVVLLDAALERPSWPPAARDAGAEDGGSSGDAPDAGQWPVGFERMAENLPTGLLCDIPSDYVSSGGDPVNPVCDLQVGHLSDRDPAAPPPETIKVVTWNVEHGKDAAGVVLALENHAALADADVLLLQESPRGDDASDPKQIDLALVIAIKRGYDFVFAVEWDRRLDKSGGGEHGLAILSKFPIGNAKLIRHTPAHDFYAEKKHFGGRATLAADLAIGARRVRLYNSHLATRDLTGSKRALQGSEVRHDADQPGQPAAQIVGGDFNTFLCNPTLYACNTPPKAETVIADFLAAGWTDLTPGFASWTQLGLSLLPQRLDWLFGRQTVPVSHQVLKDVRPADHVPVVARVSFSP